MEALLIRIDMLRDRRQYVTLLKQWLAELAIEHGRLVTMGDKHLLLIVADAAQITQLLELYKTRPIDTDSHGELCVDKFIDIVGRKRIDASGCKGFLDMNILNASMLEKMLVHEWKGDAAWLDDALSTPRTKALLAWREATKAQRKALRQQTAKERQATKAQRAEAAAAAQAAQAAQALADAKAAAGSDESDDEGSDSVANSALQQQQLDSSDKEDAPAAVVVVVNEPAPRSESQSLKKRSGTKRPAPSSPMEHQKQQQHNKHSRKDAKQLPVQQSPQHQKQQKGTKRPMQLQHTQPHAKKTNRQK